MIEFTDEEISLCKQVREKELLLKPVKEGDWVRNEYGKESTDLVTPEYIQNVLRFIDIKHWFPLWTISDCLEFLRGKGWWLYKLIEVIGGDGFWCAITNPSENLGGRNRFERHGKTALEACLKAVLAVVKEEK